MNENISVNLPTTSYPIMINDDIFELSSTIETLQLNSNHAVLITDSQVGPLYLDLLTKILRPQFQQVLPIVVPAGETSKSLSTYQSVIDQMIAQQVGKSDVIIALGGGVIGDLAGFVASTYMRGLPLIQLPTSFTAQVDASVGGKTALNVLPIKNVIGSFKQPDLVYIWPEFLQTLSQRDLLEGYVETIKMSLLAGGDFFKRVNQVATVGDVLNQAGQLIKDSVTYKAQVVASDVYDQGNRRVLNFGHTFGHALELLSPDLRHGEAVGIGMVEITKRFERIGISPESLSDQIKDLLRRFDLPIQDDQIGQPAFNQLLIMDKKHVQNNYHLVALQAIGQPIVVNYTQTEMEQFI